MNLHCPHTTVGNSHAVLLQSPYQELNIVKVNDAAPTDGSLKQLCSVETTIMCVFGKMRCLK